METEFRTFRAEVQPKIDQTQEALDEAVSRVNDLDSKHVRLFFYEKSVKRQLRLRSEDGRELEDLTYRWDGSMVLLLKSVGRRLSLSLFDSRYSPFSPMLISIVSVFLSILKG